MANFKRRKRRRGGIKGCCGLCMLRKTNGLRNGRKKTIKEKIFEISMYEQIDKIESFRK